MHDGFTPELSTFGNLCPDGQFSGNSPHTRDLWVTSATKGGRAGRFCRNGQLMVRRIPCVGGFRPGGQPRHFHPRTKHLLFIFAE